MRRTPPDGCGRGRAARAATLACAKAACVVAVAALTGCGDGAGPATSAETSPAAPDATAPTLPRPARAAAPDAAPAESASAADVDALLAAWQAARHDSGARAAAEDAVVAGGAPVLERLLAWLAESDAAHRDAAEQLIPAFGAAAVRPLTALLASEDDWLRHEAMTVLGDMRDAWAWDDDAGGAVCRALLALASNPDDRVPAIAVLQRSRPAGRCVAADVAALWRAAADDDEEKNELLNVLRLLGTDAAPAAPALVAAVADAAKAGDWPPGGTFEALRGIGPADAAVLAELRRLLADGPSDLLSETARVVGAWGEAGAAAAPELVALLHSPDEGTRDAAARALATMPSVAGTVWRDLVAAGASEDGSSDAALDALKTFARDPAVVSRLLAAFPTLTTPEMDLVQDTLLEIGAYDPATIVPVLLGSPDPAARSAAIWPWAWQEDAFAHPLPAAALVLLDDADPGVRAWAAFAFARLHAAPAARIRDVALPLVDAGDEFDRRNAVAALGTISDDDPRAFAAVVAALDDEATCETAIHALFQGDTPVPGRHPAAIAWAVENVTDWMYGLRIAHALLRLEGGADALVAALPAVFDATVRDDVNRFGRATAVVAAAGPRLAALRPALVKVRDGVSPETRRWIDAALSAIDRDADGIALAGPATADVVARLVALGDDGRRALPLLASHLDGGDGDDALAPFRGLVATDALAAAARAAPPDPHATERRHGAAALAPLVPPADACALLATLTDGPDPEVTSAAVRSLIAVEQRAPGTVSASVVAPLIDRPAFDGLGLRLAALLGPRGADLVPALRRVRDAESPHLAAFAAAALWRITHRADEALPALRRLLAHLERTTWVDWPTVGATLAELPITADDIPAIVRAIAETDTRDALVPLLARFGPAAAPAVPALRVELGTYDGDSYQAEMGASVARVLAAIGRAARPAVPDLRRWAAVTGDPDHAARDAIAAIEAAGR